VISSGFQPAELSNWSKTGRSACLRLKVVDAPTIRQTIDLARRQSLSIIAHGAGHSYTDAAWNTRGAVLDLTSMRRILSWDPVHGVIQTEPGVTLQQMLELVWMDGWWPFATPSTPVVTIGGCAAMNINGKNARTHGTFGEHLLEVEVLLAGGDLLTLAPERDPELFHAVVGGLGLLGIITRVTMQLQRIASGQVQVKKQSAANLAEVFEIFAEQQSKYDFIEGWLDGFAVGPALGRGEVTTADFCEADPRVARPRPKPGLVDRLAAATVSQTGGLFQPLFVPSVPLANRARYWWGRREKGRLQTLGRRSLLAYTYYSPAAFAGYHRVLPGGFETFQVFVPAGDAHETFSELLRYSQQQGCLPIWCIIKAHRSDPFLLSYQVDGFSLELYYPRDSRIWPNLEKVLCRMIEIALSARGRFYLAKDRLLTAAQYRRSLGDSTVEAFLRLKRRLDPEGLWQSDLYRRLFV
jgi:decaprenylphospho-beta-D-ribofuranose 2-oxidase